MHANRSNQNSDWTTSSPTRRTATPNQEVVPVFRAMHFGIEEDDEHPGSHHDETLDSTAAAFSFPVSMPARMAHADLTLFIRNLPSSLCRSTRKME